MGHTPLALAAEISPGQSLPFYFFFWSCDTPATSSDIHLVALVACIAALAFFVPNIFPQHVARLEVSEVPVSIRLEVLEGLDMSRNRVHWRCSIL